MTHEITYPQFKGPFSYQNWLLQLEDFPLLATFEYPLFTDAHITGDISTGLGPYKLINTITDDNSRRSRPAIILRADYYLANTPPQMNKTDDENYHGGLLPDEIAALTSLCLGIRLKAGEMSRYFNALGTRDPKGRPASFIHTPDPILPVIHGRPILPGFQEQHSLDNALLISKLPILSPENSIALIRAARLYENAVWIAEATPELSWLLLTSAAETVANRWKEEEEKPLERLRISRPDLERLLLTRGDESFVTEVAEQIAPYMGATKKFLDFIITFLPKEPTTRPDSFVALNWEKENIVKALQKIYTYRSRALHGGKPFPAPMCNSPHRFGDSTVPAEVPLGFASSARGATWLAKDLPMLLHTFEYIVRGSIINWWQTAAESSESITIMEQALSKESLSHKLQLGKTYLTRLRSHYPTNLHRYKRSKLKK